MYHRYYSKSKKEQKLIQIKIGVIALIFNLLILKVSITFGYYSLILFFLAITISIIAPFFDVPSLKKSGKLIYYSSLFITEKERKGKIVIHGGTLFDYVFVIDKKLNGKQRTHFILQKYLEGLLNLIDIHEKEKNTSVLIKGTTYFINERTANKLGLKSVNTDFIQILILAYNYVNLLISNSIAKKKIAFPKMNHIKTFECQLTDLIERKDYILNMNTKLKRTLSTT